VLHQVRTLPSAVSGSAASLLPDAWVPRTTDTPSSPGHLNLRGPAVQVQADIAALRRLEHGLYDRRPRR